ncbi:MAG: dTDP-4-amino-4,6-dideoxygalactose transaminase [Rhodospirillaceae bacterium]|nr:dTDP-4-amino-4,6-dideoxygalactose transaminase [Rhodospirillaceae bacterium]
MPAIPFNVAGPLGREQRYVDEVLTAPGVIGASKYTALAEQWLEKCLGTPRVLLTPSGTAALEMTALLMDLKPGDEVIMPSFTFVSTANAFVLRGATPVFVDVRPDTLNIDDAQVAGAITDRTKAIVVVHYAGGACAMAPLRSLAERHGVDIVEDAAHALLSEYRGRPLGTIGRFGVLSFHATKNITCGEGGALILNDARDIARAEIIRDKGTDRAQFLRGDVQKYSWVEVGSSYALSELSAAFLYAQLEQAHAATERRRAICAAYRDALAPLAADGRLQLPPQIPHQRDNGHIFHLITDGPEARDALLTYLKNLGIAATFHYVPLHSSPAGARLGRVSGSMAVTDRASRCLLRLPVFASMTDSQVNQVCAAVRGFYLQATASAVS